MLTTVEEKKVKSDIFEIDISLNVLGLSLIATSSKSKLITDI